jgi:lysophospholipase L1-like esterase
MSVTSDLARLSITIDRANELLLSDQIKTVDVGGGVMRATNAMVMANLATQLGGAMPYTSVALGLLGTVPNTMFTVISAAAVGYVDLYENVAGVAVFRKTYPSAEKVDAVDVAAQASTVAVAKLNGLVQGFSAVSPEVEIMAITDEEGGRHASLTSKRLQAPFFEVSSNDNATIVGDAEGAVVMYSDDQRTVVGELEMQHTEQPGIYITDAEGGVMVDGGGSASESEVATPSIFADGLLFAPVIATTEAYDSTLYIENLLVRREQVSSVIATIASTTTAESATGLRLKVNAAKFGSAAVLNVRDSGIANSRRLMNLSLKSVPVQVTPVSPKILFIGDSIGNRQGGYLLKQILQSLGFTPVFIGTIKGTSSASSTTDTGGELGECREGWETGDFTMAVNDRAIVVPPGDEAAYLAMSKDLQRERNVFVRAATGSDPESIVRNGYVFDPAFYQSRFGLATPDIVINMLGTNDARSLPFDSLYDAVLSNDTIMHSQIRAAWPNAKIIRSVPGTAFNLDRNANWRDGYTPVLRGMQKSAANRLDSKLTIAPLWAMTNPESGYSFTLGTPGVDGFSTSDWADPVHPTGASRLELYRALAPYVAAAALDLI